MRYTLLQMTQRILESMDSDEVNSHADTIESRAVANVIKESYEYLVSKSELPSLHTLFHLDASGDSTKPCLMTLPSNVIDVDYIKYKISGSSDDIEYRTLEYLPLEDFIDMTLALKESQSYVSTMTVALNGNDFTFKYRNDNMPTYYTNIDDFNLIFDSYDSTVDTTLQNSKTLCRGRIVPTFTMEDSFIPSIEPDQFQYLLNEAKSQAFVELKQTENAHSSRRAGKMQMHTHKTKHNIPTGIPEVRRRGGYGKTRG